MKIVRIFLKPGSLGYVDITPTEPGFVFPNWMTGVKAHGFQNDTCCIPWESIQCVMFQEKELLDAMQVPMNSPYPFPPRPN